MTFLATVRRELRRLFSSRPLLFLLFAWPILYGLFLADIYSTRVVNKMPVAVLDYDNSRLSRLLLRYTNADRSFDLHYFVERPDDLRRLLLTEKVSLGIYIPRGFERDVKRGKSSAVTVFVNGSNPMIANLTLADFKLTAGTIAAGAKLRFLQKTGSSKEKALANYSPIKTETLKFYNPGINYLNYLVPGLWGAILQQILLVFASLLIISEKEAGTLSGAFAVAGKSHFILAAGKSLPYFVFFFAIFEFFLRILFPYYGIPISAPVSLSVFLSLLFIYAVLGTGYFISVIVPEKIDAIKGVLIVGAPAFMMSGYVWPVAQMPLWLQPVAEIIPLTHYLRGFKKLFQYGAGFGSVWLDFLILFAFGTLTYMAGAFILSRREAMA